MKFSLINYMEHCLLSVSGQCGGKSAVSLAFVSLMCLEQRFHGGQSLHLGFGLRFFPTLPSLFTSHGDVQSTPLIAITLGTSN